MSRLLVLLPAVALFLPGCDEGACAYGPSEIRDEALSATAGATIDQFIAFSEEDAPYTHVSADEAPEGLELGIGGDGIVVSGQVDEPGTYTFVVVVEEEEGEVCAAWARYDVTLTVE
jgi:hypothetical protein